MGTTVLLKSPRLNARKVMLRNGEYRPKGLMDGRNVVIMERWG